MNAVKYLRDKLVAFQTTIAELRHQLHEQSEKHELKEKQFLCELLEIMDAFENIEKNMEARKPDLDKPARSLLNNIGSIHRKLARLLSVRHVVKMEFPDKQAQMKYCKVVDTREAPEQENNTILAVLKNGYHDESCGAVLRKAEVITVRNDNGKSQ